MVRCASPVHPLQSASRPGGGHTLSRHGLPTLPKIAGTRFVSPFQDGRRAVPASDRGIRTNCALFGPPGRPKLVAGLDFPSVLHNWPTPGGGGSTGHPKQTKQNKTLCFIVFSCVSLCSVGARCGPGPLGRLWGFKVETFCCFCGQVSLKQFPQLDESVGRMVSGRYLEKLAFFQTPP